MKIQESGEMYLETIYDLRIKNGNVRAINVAQELQYSKASVSRALNILTTAGLITTNSGLISFTPEGEEKAKRIHDRHKIISEFLQVTLDLDKTIAEKDACRLEHVISHETMMAIRKKLGVK